MGPLLILQMREDFEVHRVCSSFTSAPSGFTALPRCVVTAGKILLVGFLHPQFSEAGKGRVRRWVGTCRVSGLVLGHDPEKGPVFPDLMTSSSC